MAKRSSSALVLLVGAAIAAFFALRSPSSPGYVNPAPQDASRRSLLAGAFGAAVLPAAANAAELPFIGRQRGPFEVNPNSAVIVGDAAAPAAVKATEVVKRFQTQAEGALAALTNDTQADLDYIIEKFGIADLREATNTINNLMDGPSAAGTQRLQRLMIQAKYQLEDDVPFPVSRKGAVQPRGPQRASRVRECLQEYIQNSVELLKFL